MATNRSFFLLFSFFVLLFLSFVSKKEIIKLAVIIISTIFPTENCEEFSKEKTVKTSLLVTSNLVN